MGSSYSVSSTSLDTESVTFGEGVKDVKYYGRGATVQGLGDEGVAALSTGFTDISKTALEEQAAQSEKGYSTIEKIVENLQSGTEQALSGIDRAYAKSVSGTAALESLKPYIVGALALGAVAILSGAMKK